jgi:hypothetical protein
MPNKNPQPQQTCMPQQTPQNPQQQAGKSANKPDWVGKDTDGDGRVVKPGHRPGEIDGEQQKQKH